MMRWALATAFVVTGWALPRASSLVLATTTSVRDAGLLAEVLPEFERRTGRAVRVVAVGSGEAIAMARRGDADLLLAHDPDAEVQFMREGLGRARHLLMTNTFVLVGPVDDPAGIRGRSARDAFRRLATGTARFVSRDDRSGTHARELALWRAAQRTPAGAWYVQSGQGMSATLQIAHELEAYTLSDIATYLTRADGLSLAILVDEDPALLNPYHLIELDPERFPWIDHEGARALVTYLLSPSTQARIAAYGPEAFGRALFRPAADTGTDRS